MKKILSSAAFLGAIALLLWSCQKDELRVTAAEKATAPGLSASASTLVLEQANGSQPAVTFTFSPADFGFDAAATYTLQVSKKGTSFAGASTTEVAVGRANTRAFTVADLNKELIKVVPAGLASDVEVRVKTEVPGSAIAPLFSNVITMKVTPYRDIINYPSLYVAGNYQGWTPATAPKISSKTNNGEYEGFIFFNNASPEFKIVKGPDWGFGDYGNAGAGKLGNGGPNLTLPEQGHYYVFANTNDLTWRTTKINSWGLIGSATPTGWGADTDMTYNDATKTWSITINLVKGEVKFRANDDWGSLNFGDNGADGIPDFGGANIDVPTAGNYTVTLDLGIGGNWAYTIKRN